MGQIGIVTLPREEVLRSMMDLQQRYTGSVQITVINQQGMGENTASLTPVKLFEIEFKWPVTNLISYAYIYASPAGGTNVLGQLYKNGVAQGSSIAGNTSSIYCAFPTINFNKGDLFQVYGWCAGGGVTMYLPVVIAYKQAPVAPARSCFWLDAYYNGLR